LSNQGGYGELDMNLGWGTRNAYKIFIGNPCGKHSQGKTDKGMER
jgi:hypothetical protein